VQAAHVYRLSHASIHAFPAHASLVSKHASLVFMDGFSMFVFGIIGMMERHDDVMDLRDFIYESELVGD
jgi:hypothetical protein